MLVKGKQRQDRAERPHHITADMELAPQIAVRCDGGRGEIGVGNDDFVAMPHPRQHMEEVGMNERVNVTEHGMFPETGGEGE